MMVMLLEMHARSPSACNPMERHAPHMCPSSIYAIRVVHPWPSWRYSESCVHIRTLLQTHAHPALGMTDSSCANAPAVRAPAWLVHKC